MPKLRLCVISALAALAVAGSTTAASAGTHPTPTPTITQPVPQPVRTWTFDGQSSLIGSVLPVLVNRVDGQRALPFQNWRIRDLTPNVSVFRLGLNSITLWHSAQPLPRLNPFTCTATFNQVGRFRILNATGIFVGVRSVGPGLFTEEGLVSIPLNKYGRCPLVNPFLVRLQVIQNAIAGVNGPVAGQLPTLVDFAFQGRGLVALRPVVVPTPCPTGGGIFAPTVTPSTVAPTTSAWRGGSPTQCATPAPQYS